MKKKQNKEHLEYKEAWSSICTHHILGGVASSITLQNRERTKKDIPYEKDSMVHLAIISDSQASLYVNNFKRMDKEEWEFVYATTCIVLALDLYKKVKSSPLQELAIMLFAMHYVKNVLGFIDIPQIWAEFYHAEKELSFKSDHALYDQLTNHKELVQKYHTLNFMGNSNVESIALNADKDMASSQLYFYRPKKPFSQIFAENLIRQAQRTIALRSNQLDLSEEEKEKQNTEGYKAQKWFMNHFPLLSALAARFTVLEDIVVCQKLGIKTAAVSARDKIIYINPLAQLNEQGMRFAIAHEILHIALNHSSRRQGRDPLMWNLACDFVINHWLVEMGIGIPIARIFLDKELSHKSADEIYLMIAQDVRLKKKMGTLKNHEAGEIKKNGQSGCDMLDEDPRYFSDFEDACKELLLRGVFLHEAIGRGSLPADLVEEIKALNQPPIPWQVDLARWIAERFPLEESRRTYARPSRRQSSTPDIPRPRYVRPEENKNTRTFGVVLDTSGSMDTQLLAKCLGAIASFSLAQEVKYVRLVFCDAQPYDEGYISVDTLMNKIGVKGRGGTVLQPAINLLENSKDFPDNAPILVLSDGFFESDLEIKREHAFLVPSKAHLPCVVRGEVFEFK